MRSAPNFGDLLLDRRPSHFVPPEMRERILLDLPSASGSAPARSFARRVRTPTTWPAVHLTRWSKCHACAVSTVVPNNRAHRSPPNPVARWYMSDSRMNPVYSIKHAIH